MFGHFLFFNIQQLILFVKFISPPLVVELARFFFANRIISDEPRVLVVKPSPAWSGARLARSEA